MYNKIIKKFGLVQKSEYNELVKEKDAVELELTRAKLRILPIIDVEMTDPEPTKVADRKAYVAQAAGFHTDIMGKKLKAMVAEVREQFEQIEIERFGYSPAEFDIFLKGTTNGLWLLYFWGERMVGEQLSYDQPEDGATEEELQELHNKL